MDTSSMSYRIARDRFAPGRSVKRVLNAIMDTHGPDPEPEAGGSGPRPKKDLPILYGGA
jgi:hypothetical protein